MDKAQLEDAPVGLTMSAQEYWKMTISVCEAAARLLSAYENQQHILIDNVIRPLRQLIGQGRDLNAMKKYTPRPPTEGSSRKLRKTAPLLFDPATNWTIESPSTIHVKLPNSVITAQAITTAAELDNIIPEILSSECIALDCEFLGYKSNLPELKVLQIAVSKTRGYAVLVDVIGLDVCKAKLSSILQNEELNLVGWSFRADAQAIESAFKLCMGTVLDLQAKVKSIAIEQMSLGAAMSKYASDWEGYSEFEKAKQLGNTFQFLGADCVWLRNPLPKEALVYAAFDVVSLVELYEKMKDHRNEHRFYWPHTILTELSAKALDRWQRDRALNLRPASKQNTMTLVDQPESSKGKSPFKTNHGRATSTVSDSDADNDQDIQEAIRRSLEDIEKMERKDRILGILEDKSSTFGSENSSELLSANAKQTEATKKVSLSHDFADMPSVEPNFADDIYQKKKDDAENSKLGSKGWGELEEAPDADGAERWSTWSRTIAESPKSSARSPRPTHSTDRTQRPKVSPALKKAVSPRPLPATTERPLSSKVPVTTEHIHWSKPTPSEPIKSPKNSPLASRPSLPQDAPKRLDDAKPTRINYMQAYGQQNSGSFAWHETAEGEMDEESWKDLVDNSIKQWKSGEDVNLDLEEYEKQGKQGKPKARSEPPVKFQTAVGGEQWTTASDSWDKQIVRPNTMQIPLKGVARRTKQKFAGPKCTNVFDSDWDASDDDEQTYSDDQSVESASEETLSKPGRDDDMYVGDIYISDQISLHMYNINRPEQLNKIITKSTTADPLIVAITYHMHNVRDRDNSRDLLVKALQLYLSTGDSYTIQLDQACSGQEVNEMSTFRYLLSSPDVRRVCWCIDVIAKDLEEKIGFKLGHTYELSYKMMELIGPKGGKDSFTFKTAIEQYLKKWPHIDRYREAKQELDKIASKSFSSSIWDRKRLPDIALSHSALQGLALYALYLSPEFQSVPFNQSHVWPNHQEE
ncbi:hypothetical protein DFQ28_005339 [Apophysomyces sp. BC1034]|nr:hypothetical protein DFQ30_005173 [Apophysomyces sp. BC1015]KAG0177872.1 hypothetical protein DFQ29_004240 [Apophysomyces sp. BC1021]KAG0188138.1 hypothetical protein DFQ28_005339 [Apophysomyces sp. BC1034]